MSTTPEQLSFNLPKRSGFHYAKLSQSPRLQRVRDFLVDGEWHSSLEVVREAKIVAVSAAISELRFNGLKIDCKRNGKIWYYKLLSE